MLPGATNPMPHNGLDKQIGAGIIPGGPGPNPSTLTPNEQKFPLGQTVSGQTTGANTISNNLAAAHAAAAAAAAANATENY